jgi:uncharacterized damage-inducible protein DinB
MPDLAPVDELLALLEAAPKRISAAVARVDGELLQAPPGRGEWSATEILAHLRSCGDVWGSYIDRILTEDEPTIRATSPRTYIHSTDYETMDFRRSFRAFTAQRKRLVTQLESLRPKQWTRRATITGAGKPLVKTVHDYANWLATHERPHLKQIERAVEAFAP